jgi:hypothetical protein
MMMRPLTASGRIVPALTAGDVHYWHGDSF